MLDYKPKLQLRGCRASRVARTTTGRTEGTIMAPPTAAGDACVRAPAISNHGIQVECCSRRKPMTRENVRGSAGSRDRGRGRGWEVARLTVAAIDTRGTTGGGRGRSQITPCVGSVNCQEQRTVQLSDVEPHPLYIHAACRLRPRWQARQPGRQVRLRLRRQRIPRQVHEAGDGHQPAGHDGLH